MIRKSGGSSMISSSRSISTSEIEFDIEVDGKVQTHTTIY